MESVAFPSLGSGTQPQIPLDQAAPLAIRTILEFLDDHAPAPAGDPGLLRRRHLPDPPEILREALP